MEKRKLQSATLQTLVSSKSDAQKAGKAGGFRDSTYPRVLAQEPMLASSPNYWAPANLELMNDRKPKEELPVAAKALEKLLDSRRCWMTANHVGQEHSDLGVAHWVVQYRAELLVVVVAASAVGHSLDVEADRLAQSVGELSVATD